MRKWLPLSLKILVSVGLFAYLITQTGSAAIFERIASIEISTVMGFVFLLGLQIFAAAARWLGYASDSDASFDDEVALSAADIEPVVTWGINPGQSLAVGDRLPRLRGVAEEELRNVEKAAEKMNDRED